MFGALHHRVRPGVAIALVFGLTSCHFLLPDPRPSILLIVIDTLRADYLGCYGFDGPISPNLDRLAAESVRFQHCRSQAPWTTPSVASMMTSLLPDLYGVRVPPDAPRDHREWRRRWHPAIPDDTTTLAESLRDVGYRTGAFVANPFLIDGLGFAQGFDVFDTRRARARDRSADRLLDDSAAWLDEALDGRRPFFLYLHLMDVHGPYNAHRRHYVAVRDSPGLGPDRHLENHDVDRIQPYLRTPRWARQPEGRSLREWRARYAAGVHSADRSIGRLLDRLRDHRRWSSTIVAVTSDHGEELFDHGGWDHGFSLHDHQIRVPLILRLPDGSNAGRVVGDDIRLLDLLPTLLAEAETDPPPDVIGRDLLAPPPEVLPPAFASCNKDRPGESAVVVGGLKLILDSDSGTRQLFDLESDAHELDDLSGEAGRDTAALERVLQRLLEARDAGATASGAEVELTDEELERLRELGYID